MTEDRLTSIETSQLIGEIASRLTRASVAPSAPSYFPFDHEEFESAISTLLNRVFPFSVLSGLRLFSSRHLPTNDLAFEIDNLFHIRQGGIDYIVIVEAKKQPVRIADKSWLVSYNGKEKCAREQVDNHVRTIWEYLEPLARNTELRFIAIVASSDLRTPARQAAGYRNAEIHLCAFDQLTKLLRARFNFEAKKADATPEVLRVSQSGFLDMLRLSLAVPSLGHPELASAIRYVDRCRRSLDESLFNLFEPTADRWVINGSAGMGKSVLLAYTAAVLSSGHELYTFQGELGIKKATERLQTIGFNPDPKHGAIVVMAMSAKQLENLRSWFDFFVARFQRGDSEGTVRFRQPEFTLCRDKGSLTPMHGRSWAALLVDEAHDLPPFAARELAELYGKGGLYLVVACDRHQKLRLGGSNAKIIDGFDFSNKSTRLRQIYRNPAPVYLASLALMFRWFSQSGPKVLPTVKEMSDHFGLTAASVGGQFISVTMKSDAHPANSWCHTVGTFPDAATAYSALTQEKMGHRDVLWVRFSQEDPDFDYEQLIKAFTYHNCRNYDSEKISNKYIKGQDYPVVVIEGFPRFMDRFEAVDGISAEESEAHMWAFRRELYLCASRATGFLYFICNVEQTPEVVRIQFEIDSMIAALATPDPSTLKQARSWQFSVIQTPQKRNIDVFADSAPETAQPPNDRNIVEAIPLVSLARADSQQSTAVINDTTRTVERTPALSESSLTNPKAVDVKVAPETLPALPSIGGPQKQGPKSAALSIPTAVGSAVEKTAHIPARPKIPLPSVITARKLADLLGEPPLKIVLELKPLAGRVERDQPFEHRHAQAIVEKYGFEALLPSQATR